MRTCYSGGRVYFIKFIHLRAPYMIFGSLVVFVDYFCGYFLCFWSFQKWFWNENMWHWRGPFQGNLFQKRISGIDNHLYYSKFWYFHIPILASDDWPPPPPPSHKSATHKWPIGRTHHRDYKSGSAFFVCEQKHILSVMYHIK